MLVLHDGLSRAAQEQVSRQIATAALLGETLVQGARQIAELNMGMLRLTLEQGNLAVRQLASSRDVRQFMSSAAAQVEPAAARGFDYGYYLATITAEMQSSAIRAFRRDPEAEGEWAALAAHLDPSGWRLGVTMMKGLVESVWRLPADVARAARLALNINTPASESGRLRIAYARSGSAGR